MEEKNQMIINYINNIRTQFTNNNIPISDESVNKVTTQYLNSSKSFEEVKKEIDELVEQKLEELRKRQELMEKMKSSQMEKEKHYDLNDLFDCRISNNTLHIHVVPKSIEEDIKKVGLRNYFKLVDEKLKDALNQIPTILNDPSNSNVQSVFAVSPLLKVSMAQEIFRKFGFDVEMSNNPIFQEMFDGKRIGQAKISREKFLQLFKEEKTKYNYHTHTYRSGHGEYCSDEEMLLSAKNNGITTLGFSEHIPNPDLILPDEDHRMMLSEVDGYVASIEEMKQKHPEMTILAGFEAEYDPMKEAFLGEMREKVDYMILGQHFVPNGMAMAKQDGNPNYPIEYANMLCKAIESGLFDIVAHPDIFMQFRDSMQSEEDRKLFDENSVLASQIICEKARDMDIPIEINLSSAENNKILSDGSLAYPHPTFWQIAKEIEGLQVLQGIDAHHQEAFAMAHESEKLVANITDMVSDKMISSEYNPVVARSNNQKLQEAYKKGQDSALSFETHLVTQMATAVAQRLPNEIVSDDLAMGICTGFDSVIESSLSNANEKDKKIVEEISAIPEASDLSTQDKKGKLSRKKIAMEETNQVISNQQRAIQTAKQSVVSSVTMGCETKPELINMTTQITEHNTTKNEEHKSKIETSVASFQESKGIQVTQEKGTPLVKKPNNNNGNNSNGNGFVNVVTLSLLVTFVLGVAVGIGYMIYRFMLRG